MRKFFYFFVLCVVASFAGVAHGAEPSDKLVSALVQVESKGNDQAIGDTHLANKAYGCLQIRQPACDDVNRRQGTSYKAEDCLGNRVLSATLCKLYISMWATEARLGRVPTDEDMARIWNGGPNGWKKVSTEKYWDKVRTALGE